MSHGGSISLLNGSPNGNGANVSLTDASALESCLFCTKQLANLNEFNKRMHIENCKIRKSIEGNFNQSLLLNSSLDSLNKSLNNNNNNNTNNKQQQQPGGMNGGGGGAVDASSVSAVGLGLGLGLGLNLKKEIGIELGNQCIYCSKLFVNLSDFNKRLHFEYCKLKKKKLQELNMSNGNYTNSNNNNNTRWLFILSFFKGF